MRHVPFRMRWRPEPGCLATGDLLADPPVLSFHPQQEDGQWMMPAKDYASTRYSGLDQIKAGNVRNLKLAWTFSTGVLHGHEAAPIVVKDTMYLVTPFANLLYALDLTKPGGSIK